MSRRPPKLVLLGDAVADARGVAFRLMGLDRERFLSELLGFGALSGMGVPNGPRQGLPEAMRTVVSTRQGESPTLLS